MCGKSCVGRLAVKTVSLFLIVCTISLLSSCGGGGSSSTTSGGGPNVPPPPTASLTFLQVTPGNASVAASSTQQFSATGKYSDGSSKDLTSSVLWSSSDTSVASVNNGGLATGVVVGVVTVTAQFGAMQGSATLNITNAGTNLTGITLSPVAASVPVNTTQQFTATGNYGDGSSRDLTALVTWSSSTTSVATVNNSGLVTTVGAGTTTITATVGSFSDSSTLTVVAAHLLSIAVSPATPSIAVGTTQQFSAVGTFDDGSTQLLTSVTWSSSAASVASVSSSGLATAVGTGSTTITASSGGVTGSASLSVSAATLVLIAVTPANSSMAVGTT